MGYASGTGVPVERSRAELERILSKAGATKTAFMRDGACAQIGFVLDSTPVRLVVEVPTLKDIRRNADAEPPYGWKGGSEVWRLNWCEAQQAKEEKRKWRVLVLLLKAKLEAIQSGDTTVAREFLADLVVKGGTVYAQIADQLATALKGGGGGSVKLLTQ